MNTSKRKYEIYKADSVENNSIMLMLGGLESLKA
jgi:hypothetical protein